VAAGQRPYVSGTAAAPPTASAQQPSGAGVPRADREPVVVPDSLEPVRARASRSAVFDDTDDELDVPDFLK
jgi:hypothetical protein